MITAADTVRVGVLGPLEVTDAAGRPVHVGGQRVRALLILLALDAGRVVSARSLIERLWPDERPADAANALQSLVSRLRVALRQADLPGRGARVVGGWLPARGTGRRRWTRSPSRRRPGPVARPWPAATRLPRRTCCAHALACWRGPALADVAGQEFAAVPAARLAELRDAALLDRIEADLALGEAGPVLIGELRELTAADPLAERSDRAADARPRRRRPPGRGPGRLPADSRAAGRQPRRGPVPAARPGPPRGPQARGPARGPPAAPVPPPLRYAPAVRSPVDVATARRGGAWYQPNSFIGRDQDVAGVLKQLAAERLVTLTGPGGVGKTRLAAEAAADWPTPSGSPAPPGSPSSPR